MSIKLSNSNPLIPTFIQYNRRGGVSNVFTNFKPKLPSSVYTFTTNFEEGWENNFTFTPNYTENGNLVVTNTYEVVTDAQTSENALKVTIPQGKRDGINFLYYFDDNIFTEPDEATLTYNLKFDNNWNAHLQDDGKLPGFNSNFKFVQGAAGWGGRQPDGTDGWSARGLFIESILGTIIPIGNYVYHVDQLDQYGQNFPWNDNGQVSLSRNVWYEIKQYIKMNTPEQNDGILRCWVDDVLAFEKTDFRFRDVSSLKIQSVWFNVYLGGSVAVAPSDQNLYISNVTISPNFP